MDNIYTQKTISVNTILDSYFLDAKALYLYQFNHLPSVHYIGKVDGEKVFSAITQQYAEAIKDIHQRKWYKTKNKKFQFDTTIIVFENNLLLELESDSCTIFYDGKNVSFVEKIISTVTKFKERQRREPLEINLIIQSRNRLDLKPMEIKRTKLDLNLFYEDDFIDTDAVIQKRLKKKNDKGIILLHGLPGTGKTTYLRHLVGKIKKRVLFLSPSVAGNLMNPDFIQLLVDNPNTVLVIEDAENIIMDKKYSSSSSVSNLLNISDGLLADFLNVQLICTFNSPLTTIDSALLRKGRLIARYEFAKLGIAKAQQLSNHFGFDKTVSEPMTIAEIANPNETSEPVQRAEVMGFRRKEILAN